MAIDVFWPWNPVEAFFCSQMVQLDSVPVSTGSLGLQAENYRYPPSGKTGFFGAGRAGRASAERYFVDSALMVVYLWIYTSDSIHEYW